MSTREELIDLTVRFTDAFNRNDLEAVMSFFDDDAIYDEFNGNCSRGREAIRAAFLPQFRGDYGKIRFDTEDLFADVTSGKTLIRWTCELDAGGVRRAWRGLDILHFEAGSLKQKLTYAKAEIPRLTADDRGRG